MWIFVEWSMKLEWPYIIVLILSSVCMEANGNIPFLMKSLRSNPSAFIALLQTMAFLVDSVNKPFFPAPYRFKTKQLIFFYQLSALFSFLFFFLLLFLFCLCCFQTTELQLTSLRDHDLHHCFLIYTPVNWSISRCSYLPIISCYASCHCTYRYRVVMKLVTQNKAVGTLVFVFWE